MHHIIWVFIINFLYSPNFFLVFIYDSILSRLTTIVFLSVSASCYGFFFHVKVMWQTNEPSLVYYLAIPWCGGYIQNWPWECLEVCFSLAFGTMQEELNLAIHIYTFIVHTSYMSVKSLDNVLISSNFPSWDWEWDNVGGMDYI